MAFQFNSGILQYGISGGQATTLGNDCPIMPLCQELWMGEISIGEPTNIFGPTLVLSSVAAGTISFCQLDFCSVFVPPLTINAWHLSQTKR